MKNKCLNFGKNSENSLMGMKIHFRGQDEEELKEDLEPNSSYKSGENFWDYILD